MRQGKTEQGDCSPCWADEQEVPRESRRSRVRRMLCVRITPYLLDFTELQSIRARTFSRLAKNRCHPVWAPW